MKSFKFLKRTFHFYKEGIITCKKLQNVRLCLECMAFKLQGTYFIQLYTCSNIWSSDPQIALFCSLLQQERFVCLFVCFESHEQFFSYLATVTITGDRPVNLDLCLALTAFSSEGSFTCHTYLRS
jgi:hypothetical protein